MIRKRETHDQLQQAPGNPFQQHLFLGRTQFER